VVLRLQLAVPALVVILLSKWRIFAVRPRFWPAVLRANSIDILVGISILAFMVRADSMLAQGIWAVLYGIWLIFIKPATSTLIVTLQAALGQLVALMALFLTWASGPLDGLVLAVGLICYFAARHFFDAFDEPYAKLLAYVWGFFGSALTWVLGHLLIFYPRTDQLVAQPVLYLTAAGYGIAAIYYLEHTGKLSKLIHRELLFLMLAIVLVLTFSLFWESRHLIV
jgi:hypothetical protein